MPTRGGLTGKRRFAVSVIAGLALAGLAFVPAVRPSPVHIDTKLAAGTSWLDRLNTWRASTGVPALSENTTWSAGDYNHGQYMVKNGLVTHYETPGVPYYTPEGDTAARNGNIQVSSTTSTTDEQAIDWWMAAPFHAMGMMDPRLTQTGFGSYRDATSSPWQEGAALDTIRGNSFTGGSYPVYYPGNGTVEPLTTYGGGEFPDPLQACVGYSAPTGLPVFLQIGGNVNTVAGSVHSFTGNGVALSHCVLDTTVSAVSSYLYTRGGVILIPRQPLQSGVKYVVALTVNGVPYTWSFTVGPFWGVTGVTPGFGPATGGTPVTITGTGFTGATSVKFGSTAASFTVVSDTTITTTSPAHALGLTDVTVTTPAGTSAIAAADRFAYANPCTAVTLTASPASPSPPGTQVTLTATSTCPDPNPMYEFWAKWQGDPNWYLLQGYSASSSYNWNSTGALGGTETFGVWVKDATSPGTTPSGLGRYDTNLSVPYTMTTGHCTAVTITPAPTSPTISGTPVTFTAAALGCANPTYAFWARWQGSTSWQLLRGYSSSNVYTWNSTGAAAGTEYFGIWARDASSSATFDINASVPFSVTTQSCTSLSFSASPSTIVHGTGTQVVVTGAASGCPNARYEFWLRTTNTGWQLVQGYSSSAIYNWNSTGAPVTTVYFGIWAKDAASSTSSFDVNGSVPIPVT